MDIYNKKYLDELREAVQAWEKKHKRVLGLDCPAEKSLLIYKAIERR